MGYYSSKYESSIYVQQAPLKQVQVFKQPPKVGQLHEWCTNIQVEILQAQQVVKISSKQQSAWKFVQENPPTCSKR